MKNRAQRSENDCQAAIKVSGEKQKRLSEAKQRFSYQKRQKVNGNLNS